MISYVISRLMSRVSIKAVKNSNVHKKAKLNGKLSIINSDIGRYSYINGRCSIVNAKVGCFCSIASGCIVGGGAHPTEWVSSSPLFHSGRNIFCRHFSKHEFNPYKQTVIENDVWIGSNVLIKGGVHIGTGAVIGMGSVVTKDIPPYEIWAGNPAKKIRDRFGDEIKQKLLSSKWWELNDEKLIEVAKYMNNVPEFLNEMEKFK